MIYKFHVSDSNLSNNKSSDFAPYNTTLVVFTKHFNDPCQLKEKKVSPKEEEVNEKHHVRFAKLVNTKRRKQTKKNAKITKLGLPFIEVEDLVMKEKLNQERAKEEAERTGKASAHERIIAEAETGRGTSQRMHGEAEIGEGERTGEIVQHHDSESGEESDDSEEELRVGTRIFEVGGGGFSGAATSAKTQQALKKLLRVRKVATGPGSFGGSGKKLGNTYVHIETVHLARNLTNSSK